MCGDNLGLLNGVNCVSCNYHGHDTSRSFNSEGMRGSIEDEMFSNVAVSLTSEDGSLNSCTVGNCFIWVDGPVEGLTVEEVRDHLLYFWDTGGTTNKDNFMNIILGET